jgi:hypothetical protein
VLIENELFAGIESNITVTKPTVSNIVEDASFGSVDATIERDAVAKDFSTRHALKRSREILGEESANITIYASEK